MTSKPAAGESGTSSSSSTSSSSGTSWWSRIVTAAATTVEIARDSYGFAYDIKCAHILGNIEESQIVKKKKFCCFLRAAELSAAIYHRFGGGEPLTMGVDGGPDCVVHYTSDDETLWVVVRGTQSQADVIHDVSWIMSTAAIGKELEVPIGVLQKVSSIFGPLEEYLLRMKDVKKIKRVCFTGHSLGGAIAIGLYLAWFLDSNLSKRCNKILSKDVTVQACTFGAPMVLSRPPPTYTTETNSYAKNVHNIVTQLDVVPRLLGVHPLPDYVTQTSIGSLVHSLMTSNVHRETYRPFGRFYTLREPDHTGMASLLTHPSSKTHSATSSSSTSSSSSPSLKEPLRFGHITDPQRLLRLFPGNAADFAFGITRDHSMDRTLAALQSIKEQQQTDADS